MKIRYQSEAPVKTYCGRNESSWAGYRLIRSQNFRPFVRWPSNPEFKPHCKDRGAWWGCCVGPVLTYQGHGSIWIHTNTWRGHVALFQRQFPRPLSEEAASWFQTKRTTVTEGPAQPSEHRKHVGRYKKCGFWDKTRWIVECSWDGLGCNTFSLVEELHATRAPKCPVSNIEKLHLQAFLKYLLIWVCNVNWIRYYCLEEANTPFFVLKNNFYSDVKDCPVSSKHIFMYEFKSFSEHLLYNNITKT